VNHYEITFSQIIRLILQRAECFDEIKEAVATGSICALC